MTIEENITKNIIEINQRVKDTCNRIGRNPNEVKLLLATKTVSAENIKIALNAGYTLIGENKVQEIKEKFDILKEIPHEKHFIGHLQTNKIKDILKYEVTCVQSLDRLDLAEKLHSRLTFQNKNINAFIQVNTSAEEMIHIIDRCRKYMLRSLSLICDVMNDENKDVLAKIINCINTHKHAPVV